MAPAPFSWLTRTLASTPLNVAPDATVRSDTLLVHTSLPCEPPTKVPATMSMRLPVERENVAVVAGHTAVPEPVFLSVPAPVNVVVA